MTTPTSLEDLLRECAPQVLGVLVRRYGDFETAEDAVQEALLAATRHWPADGVPDNPRGWLIQTAARRMIDHYRSEQARRQREHSDFRRDVPVPEVAGDDDTLMLLFLCCHPSLTGASAVALTLRAVGGLTTAEIGTAFLVPEATVAQRISRAKQKIAASGRRFVMPTGEERTERLQSVLKVLYLIFNEGYTSSSGEELQRTDLAAEAIRLTRAVHAVAPDDPEVTGLLALMLLTDARRPARTGPAGELVPLAEQDRTRWDRDLIVEGVGLVARAMSRGMVGEYQLQASIAAVHDAAATAEDTDWPQILASYTLLERLSDSPMVVLNRAVATAMVDGPAAGLELVDSLDDRIGGHHRLDAVRGHLYELLGDNERAVRHYRAAATRTASLPEQHYLMRKAARLRTDHSAG